MSIKLLEQIGLNPEQAKVYLSLVSSGALPARKIALESRVNRSLVYKILKQLVELGLITESAVPGRVSTFTALHPSKLHTLVKRKEEDLKIADHALHEAVSTLGAQFNLACGKPTVRFYEGLEGLKILNKDMLHAKSNIKLIRSPLDNNAEEVIPVWSKNRETLREAGIRIKMIVPIKNTPSTVTKAMDEKYLTERKRVPRGELNNPAQVIIYGNKVALTSFADCMITTIIEDQNIRKTFDMLFDALWDKYPENQYPS